MPSIEPSTLRILHPNGKTVGSGFLVSDSLVVTCAHVLIAANAFDGDTVQVQFSGRDEKIDALVEPQYWRAISAGDVAFLRLKTIPPGLTPLRLGPAAGSASGASIYSFGYAVAAEIQGIGARGNIITLLPDGSYLQIRAHEANHGISGAAVLDEERGVVVGMITKGHNAPGRNAETTFATPSELLWEICPEIARSEICPYLGLETFSSETAQFFFGREALTEKLLTSLRAGCRFLAVFGPSGSGKSSVVKAGLLPALKNGGLPSSQKWAQISMRPADNPFEQIKAAGLESLDLQQYLPSHPGTERLVLFIDQFEELFTLCPDELRERFVRDLAAALENPRLMLVISMRDDFYSAFNAKAARLSESGHLKIENVPGTLQRDELLAMIERPAAALGLALEPGLTELILKDLARDGPARSSTLPLLEFALAQLWEKRRDGLLTHACYQSIGGVTGSLARWADEAYSDLPKSEQPLAESLLTSLVHLGDETQGLPDTRRRRALAEFDEPTLRVIRHFTDRRLLVTSAETVELLHDALLREWSRLQDWIKKNRAQLRVLETLSEAASAWRAAPQNSDLLVHRGGRLEDALKLQNRLNPQERAYLAACKTSEQRRRRSAIAAVALAMLLLTGILAGWGWTNNQNVIQLGYRIATATSALATAESAQAQAEMEKRNAEQQARVATARNAAIQAINLRDKQLNLAFLLGIEANKRLDNAETRGILFDNLRISPRLVQFVYDADVKAKQNPILALLNKIDSPLSSLAFSSDGKSIASGHADGKVRLWDAAAQGLITELAPADSHLPVAALAFSRDGKKLASGTEDAQVFIWDLDSLTLIDAPIQAEDFISSLAFSNDGMKLAYAHSTNHLIDVYDLGLKNLVAQLSGHSNTVNCLAFSPDDKLIASGSEDGTVILWNTYGKISAFPDLSGHNAAVNSLEFNPDGKTLTSVGANGTKIVWALDMQDAIQQTFATNASLLNPKISPDGKIFSYKDQASDQIVLWDIPTRQVIGTINTPDEFLAFTPQGNILTYDSETGGFHLWSAATQLLQPDKQAPAAQSGVTSVAYSPDGKILALGDKNGAISLWNMETRLRVATLTGHNAQILKLEFSSTAKYLVSSSRDSKIMLWDTSTQQPIKQPLESNAEMTFSPDGNMLAFADPGGAALLFDIAKYQPVGEPLKGHIGIYSLSFNPDGSMLASSGYDSQKGTQTAGYQTILLWDVASGLPIGQPLKNFVEGGVISAFTGLFSPDGKTLVASDNIGDLTFWDVNLPSWRERGCQAAGRNFTRAEWLQYFPGEEYRLTCPQWPEP